MVDIVTNEVTQEDLFELFYVRAQLIQKANYMIGEYLYHVFDAAYDYFDIEPGYIEWNIIELLDEENLFISGIMKDENTLSVYLPLDIVLQGSKDLIIDHLLNIEAENRHQQMLRQRMMDILQQSAVITPKKKVLH